MNAQTMDFIDRMGLVLESDGLPRIAGRIFGLLLVSEDCRSLDDLAEELEVSKGSVSTNARLLEQRGVLERNCRPSYRRDYYRVPPDLFSQSMAMAALVGTLPIALGHGAGAESRRPLGVAVVGGLLFSQIITLYITPVVYTYLDAWQKRLARRRATEPREYPEPGTGEARAAGAAG